MIIAYTLHEAQLAAISVIISAGDLSSLSIKYDKERKYFIVDYEIMSEEEWDAITIGD